jgi:hypothetical protein
VHCGLRSAGSASHVSGCMKKTSIVSPFILSLLI